MGAMGDNGVTMTVGSLWPKCASSDQVTLRRADGLKLPVHRDVVDLVAICCDVIEALGYDLVPGWCWGFSCRPIAGTHTASRHSDGSAIDLNAPTNPRRADHRFSSDIPTRVIAFMEGAGWRWGGRFSWPDPMHFEWPGTGTEAKQKARDLRAFFDSLGGNTPPPPTPIEDYTVPVTIRQGDSGIAVRKLQGLLIAHGGVQLAIDGAFGELTNSVVRVFQASHGLASDGIVGPATWRTLIEKS